MTTANDTDLINLGSGSTITLVSGIEVEVQRLKVRQLLRLLKILTNGGGPVLDVLLGGRNADDEDFGSTLLMALVFSFPNAEDETVDFLRSMVAPKGLDFSGKLSKAAQAKNDALLEKLEREFFNPEIEDLIAIVELVVQNEKEHFKALGNRLAVLLAAQQKSDTAKRQNDSKSTSKSSTKESS